VSKLFKGIKDMLLTDEDIAERIDSPLNLLNRLRNVTSPKTGIPSMPPPTTKDIGLDVESKLAAGKLRDNAAEIMGLALHELKQRIPDVQKPEKLAQIAVEMNKVLTSRSDENKNPTAQIIVYAPQVIQEAQFQTLTLVDDL
jgi:hypothetical protein